MLTKGYKKRDGLPSYTYVRQSSEFRILNERSLIKGKNGIRGEGKFWQFFKRVLAPHVISFFNLQPISTLQRLLTAAVELDIC